MKKETLIVFFYALGKKNSNAKKFSQKVTLETSKICQLRSTQIHLLGSLNGFHCDVVQPLIQFFSHRQKIDDSNLHYTISCEHLPISRRQKYVVLNFRFYDLPRQSTIPCQQKRWHELFYDVCKLPFEFQLSFTHQLVHI